MQQYGLSCSHGHNGRLSDCRAKSNTVMERKEVDGRSGRTAFFFFFFLLFTKYITW